MRSSLIDIHEGCWFKKVPGGEPEVAYGVREIHWDRHLDGPFLPHVSRGVRCVWLAALGVRGGLHINNVALALPMIIDVRCYAESIESALFRRVFGRLTTAITAARAARHAR